MLVPLLYPVILAGQSTIIGFGDSWKFYDLANEPADQGSTQWMDPSFDDVTWSVGQAQLGYGDGDESHLINENTYTAYFRHSFFVSDPTNYGTIDISLLFDDGAVVYLNGIELWRVNMPSGTPSYNTFASSSSSDNEISNQSFNNLLVQGNNTLAVEVHQRSASSSDISFDLELKALPQGQVNIVRGPYLQKMSEQSVTIKWRTMPATSSLIRYGESVASLTEVVSDPTVKTDHELTIEQLAPNQTIYYQIENESVVLLPANSDLYVKMGPTEGARSPITAWILGDCGTKNDNARSVRDAYYNYIGTQHTDMMLFLGDNAYSDGQDDEYQMALFENMYEEKLKNTVSWSCLGNHDAASAQSNTQTGPYYDIFTFPTQGECGGIPSGTEAYYSFNYGNIHFICLDSDDSPRDVGGSMYQWCENDLQNTSADWVVAFWHHPPYSKGSHDSDTESHLIDMRENFLPLLELYGVDLVLSGHSHSYERTFYLNGHYGNSDSFDPQVHTVGATGSGDGKVDGDGAYARATNQTDGAVYITTGSAGKTSSGDFDHEAVYFDVKALGSCVMEVDGGEMTVKFLESDGTVSDYFSINKDLDCTVGSTCDDGDICTINDSVNASCQCVGTPIVNPPVTMMITEADSPLDHTFMATQSITTTDQLQTLPEALITFMAPVVTLNPTFEVVPSSVFQVMQDGCHE